MKRNIVLVLLLCVLLAGCGLSPVSEAPLASPALPVPVSPDTAELPKLSPYETGEVPVLVNPALFDPGSDSLPTQDPSDGVSVSEMPEETFPHVRGPAGTVRAMTYLGFEGYDPVYGDVDGDGQTELVYWCSGPTSGLFTVGICVYGLEQGWPVLKGSAILNLSFSYELGLEQDGHSVVFYWSSQKWDANECEFTTGEALRLPVTVEDGILLLNDGDLPEGIEVCESSPVRGVVGSSFSVLRERLGSEALLDDPSCVVWRKTVVTDPDSDPAGEGEVWTLAAVTDNGVTVTGTIAYPPPGSGSTLLNLWGGSLKSIPPVEAPKALTGLTREELTERLGLCHFEMYSGLDLWIPCWFTEDGKLLIVTAASTVGFVSLWDMTAGIPFLGSELETSEADLSDLDTVIVHQEENPTWIEHELGWESFLASVDLGEECEVRLRMLYGAGEWDLTLRYDGEVFLLNDGTVGIYRYLIVDEVDDPPASARFRRATHYLLSEDPTMTWERYMARMVSSAAPPGDEFPATASLFTVYDN